MSYIKSILVLIFLGFAVISFPACGEAGGNTKEEEAKAEEDKNLVSVEVEELKPQQYIDRVTVVGNVTPFKSASLSSVEGGIIETIHKDKGAYAKEGDVIIEIDNDILKAAYDAAKSRYEFAEMTFGKQEKVYKDNVNSEYQYLQSKFERDQAKADYALAKARYEKTFIKAPFSGIVDARYFEKGELAPPGLPIVSLINSFSMKVEAGVPEQYVSKVRKGMSVEVRVPELNVKPLTGVINFVGRALSSANRNFPIEVLLKKGTEEIRPGMVAEVSISSKVYENVILIPDEVTAKTDLGYVVFVVDKKNTAKMRTITILGRSNKKIAVGSGLKAGEKLIVVGYQDLLDGEKVKIEN